MKVLHNVTKQRKVIEDFNLKVNNDLSGTKYNFVGIYLAKRNKFKCLRRRIRNYKGLFKESLIKT